MSDLYDSLEDESDEKNSSSDSLDGRKANALGSTPGASRNMSTDSGGPFYLTGNVIEEKPDSIQSFRYEKAALQKRNFLPKIDDPTKGWDGTTNLILDSQILREQGLQINQDGSFTKSPRPLVDELPFITREYRNLQFQKKKTYKMAKKTARMKIHKKSIFSFNKNPIDGISMNKIISARREKGSSEEILTSAGSLSSRRGNLPKQVLPNDNLTDSMKEKLLESQRNTPCETLKMMGSLKKTKRVMNLLEAGKGTQPSRFSYPGAISPRKINADRKQISQCNDRSTGHQKKLGKLQADVAPNGFKPCLSYSERRQLENGFNPLHLRLGSKKVLSDTNRSNFGDSVVDKLSEISSRGLSCENLRDEEEEAFYRGLIEKDRNRKPIQRSSRSEGPCQFPKLKSSVESGSSKEQKQVRQNNLKFKPISKSMSIDLPSESENGTRTFKKYHYCSADNSPNLSKFELALKAKTYGYLANARNIFKMKAQSEGKLSPKEGERNPKFYEREKNNSSSAEKTSDGQRRGKNFPGKSILPEVPGKVLRSFDRASRTRKPAEEGLRGLDLPRVAGATNRDTKIQAEILNRMSSCLNSPNGRIENVLPATFK